MEDTWFVWKYQDIARKFDSMAHFNSIPTNFDISLEWTKYPSTVRYLEYKALRLPLPAASDTEKLTTSPNLLTSTQEDSLQSFSNFRQSFNTSLTKLEEISAWLRTSDDLVPKMMIRIDDLSVEVNEKSSRRLKAVEDWIQAEERRIRLRGGWRVFSVELGYQALAALLTGMFFSCEALF
jgi:methyl-accepting chemotaxis protein